MADIGTSVLLASVVVGMMSIPAAATNMDAAAPSNNHLPSISASDKTPSNKVVRTTQDSFVRKVETAFNSFRVHVSSDSATTQLEDPNSRLKIKRSPESTTWTLKTSRGTLKVTSRSEGSYTKVETPYGTLSKSRVHGSIKENFSGSNRDRVESIAKDLRSKMEAKKKEVRRRNQEMAQESLDNSKYSESLSIGVQPKTPEYVVVNNSLSTRVNLKDWNLTDEATSYSFGDVDVPAQGTLYVYSDDKPEGLKEKKDANYVYGTDIGWNDGGDTATLWHDGEKIARKSY
ncbi:MAG: lamin tail domain-containing protein [Candidatus Nanohaloarchaea archaeon]